MMRLGADLAEQAFVGRIPAWGERYDNAHNDVDEADPPAQG